MEQLRFNFYDVDTLDVPGVSLCLCVKGRFIRSKRYIYDDSFEDKRQTTFQPTVLDGTFRGDGGFVSGLVSHIVRSTRSQRELGWKTLHKERSGNYMGTNDTRVKERSKGLQMEKRTSTSKEMGLMLGRKRRSSSEEEGGRGGRFRIGFMTW